MIKPPSARPEPSSDLVHPHRDGRSQGGAGSPRGDGQSRGGAGTPRGRSRGGVGGPAVPPPALPAWLWAPGAFALAALVVPVIGLLVRVPWPDLPALLARDSAQQALRLSLVTCLTSTALCLLLGVPLALLLARSAGRWTAWARTLVAIPMVLPPVVAGLALLITLGRRGVLGASLSAAGIEIGFTTVAVVIAQTFVALPYLVTSVDGAARAAGAGYEAMAAVLGASPSRVFRRVTLPLLAPAIASGAALSFARALGEFGATLTFAGSLPGTTRTLPLEIYLARESDSDAALALAVVLIALAVLTVAVTGWLGRTPVRRGHHA